jgi:hypothetical protein
MTITGKLRTSFPITALHLQTETSLTNYEVKTTIEACREVIPREERWRYKFLNPTLPTIRRLEKVHKDDNPHKTGDKLEECTGAQDR